MFGNTSPILLKRIDELTISSYRYLYPEDEVYYLDEYTPRKGAAFSKMNQLILNYKKEVDRKDKPEWTYKKKAIIKIAALFRQSIFQTKSIAQRAATATLVPIPPSAAKDAENYDDRNIKLLHEMIPQGDIRELIIQKQSREPLHSSKQRRNPSDLMGNYKLNTTEKEKAAINEIWLFDDVLTLGTHFRAACDFLTKELPMIKIAGFFIARSVYLPEQSELSN